MLLICNAVVIVCRVGGYACPLVEAGGKNPLAHLLSGPLLLPVERAEEVVGLLQSDIHHPLSIHPLLELLLGRLTPKNTSMFCVTGTHASLFFEKKITAPVLFCVVLGPYYVPYLFKTDLFFT